MLQSIKRWWNELRNPARKCARVGHLYRLRYYKGLEKPLTREYRVVAYDVRGHISACGRCGVLIDRTVDYKSYLTGFTLPAHVADKLERDGFVEL